MSTSTPDPTGSGEPAGVVSPSPGVRAVQLTDDADREAIAAWCGGRLHVRAVSEDEYAAWVEIPRSDGYPSAFAYENDWIACEQDHLPVVMTPHMWQTEYREERAS